MSFYNVHGDRLYTSFAALWSIFINTAYDARLGRVYCILDTLNECEEQSRAELIQQIGSHFSGTLVARSGQREWAGLKLIITSRPYDDIRIRLSQLTVIRLKAEQKVSTTISHCTLPMKCITWRSFGATRKISRSMSITNSGMAHMGCSYGCTI